MKFLESIPTRTVEVIDFEQLVASVGIDIWTEVMLTYSQRNSIAVWLKKHHPDLKFSTRQLDGDYQLAHKEPRLYAICFTTRKEPKQ